MFLCTSFCPSLPCHPATSLTCYILLCNIYNHLLSVYIYQSILYVFQSNLSLIYLLLSLVKIIYCILLVFLIRIKTSLGKENYGTYLLLSLVYTIYYTVHAVYTHAICLVNECVSWSIYLKLLTWGRHLQDPKLKHMN